MYDEIDDTGFDEGYSDYERQSYIDDVLDEMDYGYHDGDICDDNGTVGY